MVAAVLKLYFIGTALSVLAVLFGIVDSFGGLMYVQDHHYILELDQQKKQQTQASSSTDQRRSSLPKRISA
ncbi:uncharacterized protein V6R79_002601 [Siganus canaliculatus]